MASGVPPTVDAALTRASNSAWSALGRGGGPGREIGGGRGAKRMAQVENVRFGTACIRQRERVAAMNDMVFLRVNLMQRVDVERLISDPSQVDGGRLPPSDF